MQPQKIDPQKLLKTFAKSISSQALGPIVHSPELFAEVNICYDNVKRKVDLHGGNIQYGWTFVHRLTANFQSIGYFMATHHAVWRAPNDQLIDITPFHTDIKHQPYAPDGRLYFLVDDKAQPVRIGQIDAPLPLKFFPLNDGKKLLFYIGELRANEEEACQKLYAEYRLIQSSEGA